MTSNRPTEVDFDLHGLIGVRLVDPSSRDVAAVRQQLGVTRQPLSREPDITLRFVKHLLMPPLRHLGFKKLGFTDNALFVFEDGAHGRKVRIPFAQLGRKCEILCESGLQSVPLLKPILALTAQAKGFASVHASAFVHNGVGVLMAGWAESGKTTALLGFATRGAELIGEDWVLVSRDGQKMCGLPTMIKLSSSHLETVPQVRRTIKRSSLLQLADCSTTCTAFKMPRSGKKAIAPSRESFSAGSLLRLSSAPIPPSRPRLFLAITLVRSLGGRTKYF